MLRVFARGLLNAVAFARWVAFSSAAIDVDSFGARATLDVAAPVVLAVAPMSHLDCFYCVSATAAHRSAASRARMILLTLAVTAMTITISALIRWQTCFYRATRMHRADYAVARCLSVCLSVRLSVHLSFTRRYSV